MKHLILFLPLMLLILTGYSQNKDTLRYTCFEQKKFNFATSQNRGEVKEADHKVRFVKDEMLRIGSRIFTLIPIKSRTNKVLLYRGRTRDSIKVIVTVQSLKDSILQVGLMNANRTGLLFYCKKD
jgi:hypothetical protein